jgi:hypothetical protein
MIFIEKIREECKWTISALVQHGKLVCDEFQAKKESTYFCEKCGYSQYIHLCKQVAESR